MIAFASVEKSFGAVRALDGVTLEVPEGEVTFVVGPSGAGKSVLSKCAVGLTPVDGGELRIDGERADGLPERRWRRLRRKIGLVLQAAPLLDWLSLEDNVRLAGAESRSAARELLAQVELLAEARKMPAELGTGARRRAGVARALATGARCLIYDEPTTGLAPATARKVDELIRRIVDERGGTALVVSHDLASMRGIADRIAFLYQGRIRALGTFEALSRSDDPVVAQFMAGRPDGPMETS